jgi:hypothetical protein
MMKVLVKLTQVSGKRFSALKIDLKPMEVRLGFDDKPWLPDTSNRKDKIFKIKTIFLSDMRLSNRSSVRDIKNMVNMFRVNPYHSYDFKINYLNKQGNDILFKPSLSVSVLQETLDKDKSFLIKRVESQHKSLYTFRLQLQPLHN